MSVVICECLLGLSVHERANHSSGSCFARIASSKNSRKKDSFVNRNTELYFSSDLVDCPAVFSLSPSHNRCIPYRQLGCPQTTRVQRAPSLSLSILVAGFDSRARGRIVSKCAYHANTFHSVFLFCLLSLIGTGVLFRVRAGRLSERDQSAVALPLLLSCNGCRRQ